MHSQVWESLKSYIQMEVKAWEAAILNIFVEEEWRSRCIQSFVPNRLASKSGCGVKAFSG